MNKGILAMRIAAVTVGAALAPVAAADHAGDVNKALAEVRAATADFHHLATANAAGWSVRASDCVAVPGVGGMGWHYLNPALAGDGLVDAQLPEVLVYAPTPAGGRRLVAVEWVAPLALHPSPPTLFGETFHFNPHVGGPQGAWILHAWIWHHNPTGVFSDFNPRVSCPAP